MLATVMCRHGHATRGVSLIEMMVALALGLFLVGVGASVLLGQIGDQRRRLLEVRLNQELRGALGVIERDLRRAGQWGDAAAGVWLSGDAPSRPANPYAALYPAAGDATTLGYTYSRDPVENGVVDSNERFGLRIHPTTRALEMRLGGAALTPATGDGWQALTDPAVVRMTRLAVRVESTAVELGDRCSLPCPTSASGCPPTQALRSITVEVGGTAVADAALSRVLRNTVRVRADAIAGACPVGP